MKWWLAISIIAVSACDARPLPPPPSRVAIDERFPYNSDDSSALDMAVMSDRVDEVRRLLESGADPNVRCCGGDKFALMEAFRDWAPPITHRVEIIRLLLAHGADPNMQWCPFETRGSVNPKLSCVSAHAWTALIAAAYLDSPEIVEMLLAAGANPWPRDWVGAAAVDYASSERVLQQLAGAHFPEEAGRSQKMLRLLDEFSGRPDAPTPWNVTALSRALLRGGSYGYTGSTPPPRPDLPGEQPGVEADAFSDAEDQKYYFRVPNRVKALLALGVNPNERVTRGGADWPPLAMAVHIKMPQAVEHLLDHHADVNARWCVPIDWTNISSPRRSESGCTPASGFTPLMWATRIGHVPSIRVLLARGADRSLKDWAGRTALDYASTRGMKDVLAAGR